MKPTVASPVKVKEEFPSPVKVKSEPATQYMEQGESDDDVPLVS